MGPEDREREGVEGEETWEGRSKAFIVMKYFCLILVACLSIWLSLSLYFSLPLSLSPPRPSIVLSRALKKRLVGFAYSSTLKRSRGGKEREREWIFILPRQAKDNPYLTLGGRGTSVFYELPSLTRTPFDEKEEEEESSDGLKLLRRFVAYLVKRGRRGFFFTGLRFVLFFLPFSSSFSFFVYRLSLNDKRMVVAEKSEDLVWRMDSFMGWS